MAELITKKRGGQSLVEILVAVSVGAIIVASAAAALVTTVRGGQVNRATDTASSLAQELMDNTRSYGEGNWQDLYAVSKWDGTGNPCSTFCYYLATGGSPFTLTNGTQQLTVNNVVFTRSFTVQNVNRDNCGTGSITAASQTSCTGQPGDILEDPSTQKIIVDVTWPQIGGSAGDLKITGYVTHYTNQTSNFSDWSGSSGTEGPVTQPSNGYSSQSGLDTSGIPGSVVLSGGVPSGHWDGVNDTEANPGDGMSTYVYTSSGTEQKDAYAMQNHTSESGTINTVTITVYAKGDGCFKPYMRLGTSELNNSTSCGGDTSWNLSSFFVNNPPGDPGGTFDWTEIDNLQAGVGLYKTGAIDMKATKVYISVSYTGDGGNPLILRPMGDGDYTSIASSFP